MTNVISNSIVVIDASTNGVKVGVVNMMPIYGGVVVIVGVVISLGILFAWLKKSK